MHNRNLSKIACAIALSAILSGCGNRYLSSRATNPLIEDRVRMGPTEQQKMSVLTSRADRRTILVFDKKEICAEPPPDVAEAVYSQAIAEIAAKEVNAAAGSTLQTALMQLTRRSQGLDFYRTGAFVNCMRHYTGAIDKPQYVAAMDALLNKAVELTTLEINNLPAMMATVAQVTNPQSTKIDVASPANANEEKKATDPKEGGTGGGA